jgi:hypothetical protein
MKHLMGIAFFFIATGLFAQDEFASSKLHELFDLLPKNCKESISSLDSFTCRVKGNDLHLKIIQENGVIIHIGLNLFRKNEIGFSPDCVIHFIERYFLELLITEDKTSFTKRSGEQQIILMFNDQQIDKSKFSNINNIHLFLNRQLQKDISKDSIFYRLILSDGFNELKLLFPANNNIVNGMDKFELDKNLELNLKHFNSKDNTTVIEYSTTDLEQFHEYFISKGETYYKTITSNTYYRKVNNEYLLLYDKKYLAATLANLFIMGHNGYQKQIGIKHLQYGKKISYYSLFLNDFVSYFKHDNCKLYVGIENESDDKLQATLVIYNPILNCVNIGYINTTASELFDSSQKINIKMYSNIPSDNIKDLYGVYIDENNFE